MEDNKPKATYDENLHTYKTIEAKPVYLPDDYYFFKQPLFKRFINKIVLFFATLVSQITGKVKFGYKLKGRKNLRKVKGAILIANHIHPFDAFLSITSLYPKRAFATILQTNLGLPGGNFMRMLGAIPIPDRKNLLIRFMEEMKYVLEVKKQKVLIYPEAALVPFSNEIREFKKGAFKFACLANVPIIPMVWTFHKPRGLYRLFKKKPCLHLTALEPYYVEKLETKHQTIEKALNDCHKIMDDYFKTHNEVNAQE